MTFEALIKEIEDAGFGWLVRTDTGGRYFTHVHVAHDDPVTGRNFEISCKVWGPLVVSLERAFEQAKLAKNGGKVDTSEIYAANTTEEVGSLVQR